MAHTLLRVTLFVLICAATAGAQSSAFRQAVEAGHRDRLDQVAPGCPPLERQLAKDDAVWSSGGTQFSPAEREAACLLAAQYAQAGGDARAALRAATECVDAGDAQASDQKAQWLLAQAELAAGEPEAAMTRADWLSRHAKEPWKGKGLFVQAQCAATSGDTAEAIRLLKMCTRLKGHDVVGPAYLELGRLHEAQGESERAMHYLTLYRETFPRGLVPQFEFAPGASSRADAAAGVEYTIQVGVFGDRTNAVKLADKFKETGRKAELVPRTISGQKYTAVWVGRYKSQNEAQEARRRLETLFDESYRVVVRE
jgi:tetratricopeptide (TPR) repeat protein